MTLLVVSESCYKHYKNNKLKLSSRLPDVVIHHSAKPEDAKPDIALQDDDIEVVADEDEDLNISSTSEQETEIEPSDSVSRSASTLSLHSCNQDEKVNLCLLTLTCLITSFFFKIQMCA